MNPSAHLIIVEGPDGAGKSHLVLELSRTLKLPFLHTGGSSESLEHFQNRMSFIERLPPHILDRTPHISESIYRKARGLSPLLPCEEVLDRLSAINPILIFCAAQPPSLISLEAKPHKTPEQLQQSIARRSTIRESYLRIERECRNRFPVIHYNWRKDSTPDLVGRILELDPCVD